MPPFLSSQISAASLGAQPQFISSLTSTPIITSAMSGITSQIITNAQGQVGYSANITTKQTCSLFFKDENNNHTISTNVL